MIKAINLTKRYGRVEALSALSLEVPCGEILALVGPNGAGKTTALKLLVGLLAPTAGEVWIGGYQVFRQPLEAKRLVAFLPDQPFLYEQLTVAETIGFIGAMYQMAPQVLHQRAKDLLQVFGLTESLANRVSQLSYGMKSRLALVTSLLHDPRALILDEPFFGLDPQTLRLAKQVFAERARHGMALVLSTHQLSVVDDLAHRIAILNQGRLVVVGTRQELHQRYGGTRLEDVFFQVTAADTQTPSDG